MLSFCVQKCDAEIKFQKLITHFNEHLNQIVFIEMISHYDNDVNDVMTSLFSNVFFNSFQEPCAVQILFGSGSGEQSRPGYDENLFQPMTSNASIQRTMGTHLLVAIIWGPCPLWPFMMILVQRCRHTGPTDLPTATSRPYFTKWIYPWI